MRSPGSTSRSTSCSAGIARHLPCPPETCATSCQWEALPLAAAVRASAGAWTAPPRRLPCTGLPCREPCLPAPAVRPWCSGRCAGRTSACTSRRTSCAGAPAVARRGAGSVWNALHGTGRPARPDTGRQYPQASRSRPGRATGHPRGQAMPPKPCLPVSESKPFSPSKAASRPKGSVSGLALYWPSGSHPARIVLLFAPDSRAHPALLQPAPRPWGRWPWTPKSGALAHACRDAAPVPCGAGGVGIRSGRLKAGHSANVSQRLLPPLPSGGVPLRCRSRQRAACWPVSTVWMFYRPAP